MLGPPLRALSLTRGAGRRRPDPHTSVDTPSAWLGRQSLRRSRTLLALGSAALAAAILITTVSGPAGADVGPATRVSAVTTVGVHNTYVRSTYPYLAQALDARPGLIELDVWDDTITREWKVSHNTPLGNDK